MQKSFLQSLTILAAAASLPGIGGCHASQPQTVVSLPGYHQTLTERSSTQPTTAPTLMTAEAVKAVDALVCPPIGWREDPRRIDAKHAHLVWKSPSGDTAYGIVLMHLPWPVGPDLVLTGFMNHLRETDTEARLLDKQAAEDLHGYRFVAESGQYVLRVDLSVRGWRAWAVYAGSLRAKGVNPAELELAEEARDRTRVGLPAESAFAE